MLKSYFLKLNCEHANEHISSIFVPYLLKSFFKAKVMLFKEISNFWNSVTSSVWREFCAIIQTVPDCFYPIA